MVTMMDFPDERVPKLKNGTLTPGQKVEIRIVADGPWYRAKFLSRAGEGGFSYFELRQTGDQIAKTDAQLRDEVREVQ